MDDQDQRPDDERPGDANGEVPTPEGNEWDVRPRLQAVERAHNARQTRIHSQFTNDTAMEMRQDWIDAVRLHLTETVDLKVLAPTSRDPERIPTLVAEIRKFARSSKGSALGIPDSEEVAQRLLKQAVGMGVLQPLLDDPEVTDILVQRHDFIKVDRAGQLSIERKVKFASAEELLSTIQRFTQLAGQKLDHETPTVDFSLPDGTRVNAVIPPATPGDAYLTIRRAKSKAFRLADFVKAGAMSAEIAEFLTYCRKAHLSLVTIGPTGAGKSTIIETLIAVVQDEEIVLCEEVAELKPDHQHLRRLVVPNVHKQGANAGDSLSLNDLVRNSLRMRPDVIVVGEARGPEAEALLSALTTGHRGGMTTMHAEDAQQATRRMAMYAMMGKSSFKDLGPEHLGRVIVDALDICITMRRHPVTGMRVVWSIDEITSFSGREVTTTNIYRARWERQDGRIVPVWERNASYKAAPKVRERLREVQLIEAVGAAPKPTADVLENMRLAIIEYRQNQKWDRLKATGLRYLAHKPNDDAIRTLVQEATEHLGDSPDMETPFEGPDAPVVEQPREIRVLGRDLIADLLEGRDENGDPTVPTIGVIERIIQPEVHEVRTEVRTETAKPIYSRRSDRIVSVAEAARFLGISPSKVRRLDDERRPDGLVAQKTAEGERRYTMSQLEEYARQHKLGPFAEPKGPPPGDDDDPGPTGPPDGGSPADGGGGPAGGGGGSGGPADEAGSLLPGGVRSLREGDGTTGIVADRAPLVIRVEIHLTSGVSGEPSIQVHTQELGPSAPAIEVVTIGPEAPAPSAEIEAPPAEAEVTPAPADAQVDAQVVADDTTVEAAAPEPETAPVEPSPTDAIGLAPDEEPEFESSDETQDDPGDAAPLDASDGGRWVEIDIEEAGEGTPAPEAKTRRSFWGWLRSLFGRGRQPKTSAVVETVAAVKVLPEAVLDSETSADESDEPEAGEAPAVEVEVPVESAPEVAGSADEEAVPAPAATDDETPMEEEADPAAVSEPIVRDPIVEELAIRIPRRTRARWWLQPRASDPAAAPAAAAAETVADDDDEVATPVETAAPEYDEPTTDEPAADETPAAPGTSADAETAAGDPSTDESAPAEAAPAADAAPPAVEKPESIAEIAAEADEPVDMKTLRPELVLRAPVEEATPAPVPAPSVPESAPQTADFLDEMRAVRERLGHLRVSEPATDDDTNGADEGTGTARDGDEPEGESAGADVVADLDRETLRETLADVIERIEDHAEPATATLEAADGDLDGIVVDDDQNDLDDLRDEYGDQHSDATGERTFEEIEEAPVSLLDGVEIPAIAFNEDSIDVPKVRDAGPDASDTILSMSEAPAQLFDDDGEDAPSPIGRPMVEIVIIEDEAAAPPPVTPAAPGWRGQLRGWLGRSGR